MAAKGGDPPYWCIPKAGIFSRDAEDWYKRITDRIRSRRQLDNITITEVKWFKDKHGLAHECLVFTATIEDLRYELSLAIERSTTQEIVESALKGNKDKILQLIPDETLATMNHTEKQKAIDIIRSTLKQERTQIKRRMHHRAIRSKPFATISSIINPNKPLVAMDVITPVDFRDGSGEPTEKRWDTTCLKILTFGETKFRLRDLCFMVREIHASHKEYTLRKYNCYWFARTLVEVIETLMHPTSVSPNVAEVKAGCVPGFPKRFVQSDRNEVEKLVIRAQAAMWEHDEKIMRLDEDSAVLEATLAWERREHEEKEAASKAALQALQAELERLRLPLTREHDKKMTQIDEKPARLEAILVRERRERREHVEKEAEIKAELERLPLAATREHDKEILQIDDSPYNGIPKTGLLPRDIADGIWFPHDLENGTISKVRRFKDEDGLAHECLVFTVNVEDPQYESFLAIERSTTPESVESALLGNKDDVLQLLPEEALGSMNRTENQKTTNFIRSSSEQELEEIKFSMNHSASHSKLVENSSHISTPDSPLVAMDEVTRIEFEDGSEFPEKHWNGTCLKTLTFGETNFRLPNLGIMVREIHAAHEEYTVGKYNSDWFVSTLVEVIETLMNPTSASPNVAEEKAGFVPGFSQRLVQSEGNEVGELVMRIQAAIQEDDEKITQIDQRLAVLEATLESQQAGVSRA